MNELPLIPDVDPPAEVADAATTALWYHERTKHHLHRYARRPGYLDWATQPDPFRTFAGAPTVELPLLADAPDTPYADLYGPGAVAPRRSDVDTVAVLFELAWGCRRGSSTGGSRWALRCNPSSGNLHPTEGYAVLPAAAGAEAGVYHYVSRDHLLERRCTLSAAGARRLAAALPTGTFLVGLSSIHWREAWKYGERAFRYCQHDVGHALAAVRYAAAALGWSAGLLDTLGDDDVAALLGLDRDGRLRRSRSGRTANTPTALLLVGPSLPSVASPVVDAPAVLDGGAWAGRRTAESQPRALGRRSTRSPGRRPSRATPPADAVAHPSCPPLAVVRRRSRRPPR